MDLKVEILRIAVTNKSFDHRWRGMDVGRASNCYSKCLLQRAMQTKSLIVSFESVSGHALILVVERFKNCVCVLKAAKNLV